MWKLLLAATIIVSLGEAQRSSYAARPGSRSKLLPRFRKNQTDSDLGTRGGDENSTSVSTTTLSPDLEGTLEDHRFVHRVSHWPEDRQPFWFKNRHAISSMRGREIDGGNYEGANFDNQRPRPPFQSPFQGPGRGMGRGRGRPFSDLHESDPFMNDMMGDPFGNHRRGGHHR